MKIVVIGGTGLIGSKLVTQLGERVTRPCRIAQYRRELAHR